jgi:glycerol-3-phosphate dehydrogenase
MQTLETQVVVIGGGVAGCGVLRDLAMRGVDALLFERGQLAQGTSGNFHGLFHSGGRYAVDDQPAARACIQENRILRHIAPHAIEDTGGFFVVLDDGDEAFLPRFLDGCEACGIPTEILSGAEALREEPALSPQVRTAVAVPDGVVDAQELCIGSVNAARALGARVLLLTAVTDILRSGDRVVGVRAQDQRTGETYQVRADVVINASGPWTDRVANLAGIRIPIVLDEGAMVVMDGRPVRRAINRCRFPADGDIIVPMGQTVVLGTTSVTVEDPDDASYEQWEVDKLVAEGVRMVPAIEELAVQRPYAGVRPLYEPPEALADDEQGRDVSRAHDVLDHEERDGVGGFITITGGKVTTFRQMAEDTVDLLAEKMGIDVPCRTAEEPLPTG